MTKVIHIKDVPSNWRTNDQYVYVGRAGKGLSGYFGNKHPVGFCYSCRETHARGEAVKLFERDFKHRIKTDVEYFEKVCELRGKYLVCFCVPNPCHADVFVAFLEGSYE